MKTSSVFAGAPGYWTVSTTGGVKATVFATSKFDALMKGVALWPAARSISATKVVAS